MSQMILTSLDPMKTQIKTKETKPSFPSSANTSSEKYPLSTKQKVTIRHGHPILKEGYQLDSFFVPSLHAKYITSTKCKSDGAPIDHSSIALNLKLPNFKFKLKAKAKSTRNKTKESTINF